MKAFELIDQESKWCNDAFAKDATGQTVYWMSPAAVQFDLTGALHRTYHGQDLEAVYCFIYRQSEMADKKSLPYYNRIWGWEGCYNFLKKCNI